MKNFNNKSYLSEIIDLIILSVIPFKLVGGGKGVTLCYNKINTANKIPVTLNRDPTPIIPFLFSEVKYSTPFSP